VAAIVGEEAGWGDHQDGVGQNMALPAIADRRLEIADGERKSTIYNVGRDAL
jgi:hypothetical protein